MLKHARLLNQIRETVDFLQEAEHIVREQGMEELARRLGLNETIFDAVVEQLARHTTSLLKTGHIALEDPELTLASGVEATVVAGQLRVRIPYYPPILDELRSFGRWDASARQWVFREADIARLKRLMQETFGRPEETRVAVRMRVGGDVAAIYELGRLIVERPAHSSRVRLGPGVEIVEGDFPAKGGSRRKPSLDGYAVVVVHKVPLSVAQRFLATKKELYAAELIEDAQSPADS